MQIPMHMRRSGREVVPIQLTESIAAKTKWDNGEMVLGLGQLFTNL